MATLYQPNLSLDTEGGWYGPAVRISPGASGEGVRERTPLCLLDVGPAVFAEPGVGGYTAPTIAAERSLPRPRTRGVVLYPDTALLAELGTTCQLGAAVGAETFVTGPDLGDTALLLLLGTLYGDIHAQDNASKGDQ